MVAEQGTQSRSVHACSACTPFQNNTQRGTAGTWTFELQMVIEQLNSFWCQGKEAKLVAFPANPKLRFGKQYSIAIQGQYLGGAKPMQEHQTHHCQVACTAKTGPETRYFIDRERHNVGFRYLHS